MYLPRPATEKTLRTVAGHRPGTTLVVNFVLPAGELDELAAAVTRSAASAVAEAHEPVLACYTAAEAASMLRDAGFGDVRVLDARALGRRFLTSKAQAPPRLPGSTVVAVATV